MFEVGSGCEPFYGGLRPPSSAAPRHMGIASCRQRDRSAAGKSSARPTVAAHALASAIGILAVTLTELRYQPAFQVAVAFTVGGGAVLLACHRANVGSAVAIAIPKAACPAAVVVGLINFGFISTRTAEQLAALRTLEPEATFPVGTVVVAGSFGAYLGAQPPSHLAPAPKWVTVGLLLSLAVCADAVKWAPPTPTPDTLCFLKLPLPLALGAGLTFALPTVKHPFCVPLLVSVAALDAAQHLSRRWPSGVKEQQLQAV